VRLQVTLIVSNGNSSILTRSKLCERKKDQITETEAKFKIFFFFI